MLTEKENYLRVLTGQVPEWIPEYTFGKMPWEDKDPANVMVEPSILCGHRDNNGGLDHWGVEYVTSKESAGAIMPKTWDYILPDITKWRDVIKAPSLEGIDWEDMAKKSVAKTRVNRNESVLALNLHVGYFQNLMAFMGFEEGLMALYEEPEEVKALMEYMCDFYCTVCERIIDYIKPDVITLMDDTASWNAPFVSHEMYREFFLPYYDRQAKFGRDRGLPITFHNCGKCEAFVDDMVSIGVNAWDPAQTCNDLAGIKAKYGNKLAIMGGWDSRGRLLDDDVSDDEIRQSVIDTVNMLAPGGGFAWCGGFMGVDPNDPIITRKNKVLKDTFNELSKTFYK